MYAWSADPWALAARWYEQRKYAITMSMLPTQRYQHAFEPVARSASSRTC
jgi:hypothetical protein